MTQPTEFEKRIQPTINVFVADLTKLICKLVEEAVLHGGGLDSLKAKPKKTAKRKPAKPPIFDINGRNTFANVAREVMGGRKQKWSSLRLAQHLTLGETTVRGHLKELVALGVVLRIEGGPRGQVLYTRKAARATLKRVSRR